MEQSGESPIWKPRRDTRIDLPNLCYMHGGPKAMHLPEHEHDEVQLEMHFLSQRLGRRRLLPGQPDFLKLIPSRKPHIGRWRDGDEVVVVLLGQDCTARAAEECLRNSSSAIIGTECAVDPVLQAIGATLRREFLASGGADKVFLEAIGIVLSGHLLRRWSSRAGHHGTAGRLTPAQLRQTMQAIAEAPKTSIASLAHEIGLGSHQFTRLFRRTTGHSPYQYLVQQRLAQACALLESTQLPLAQIALQVGFASQSHFTSVFHKHFRSTPYRFRQERQRRKPLGE